MPKKYPDEFKAKAVRRYEKGESIQSLCQELHISPSTLYHWRRQYCSIRTPTHTYTPKEFDSIARRLQKAEHKLEIVQLSGYISKVPLQNRFATLEHLHNEFSEIYSVHELCEAFDVASSIRTDAKKLYKAQQQRKKQNLLNREFHAEFPNQIWISDITYFKIKDSWLYLCVIIDLFSRKVIAHRISRSIGARLVTAIFRAAYAERRTPKDLTFHSDRGVQYISKSFSKILQLCGARQSFSATARPHDNAVAEAFFATFKKKRHTAGNIHRNAISVKA